MSGPTLDDALAGRVTRTTYIYQDSEPRGQDARRAALDCAELRAWRNLSRAHEDELARAAAYARERRTCHAWEIRRARRSRALSEARIDYERADGPNPSSGREAIARRAALHEIVTARGRSHADAVRRVASANDARERIGFQVRWDLAPGWSQGALVDRRVLVTEAP